MTSLLARWPRLLVCTMLMAGPRVAAAQPPGSPDETPIPTVTGPVAVTADSYPMMAASRLQEVVDLAAAGYVEEEYFVSGRANIYDWAADGPVSVRTPDAPYATRILVRRPADPRRASGAAVVELANSARRYDFSFTWAMSYRHFMDRGDTWVGLTWSPEVIAGLKAFDARRYAPLSMAGPARRLPCAAGPTPAAEDGLLWDILSQVGALLKNAPPNSPLAAGAIRRVYATSHGGELPTYVAAVHPRARLARRPVFDGFVIHRHTPMVRINACATAPPAADPRQILRHVGVPVVRIVSETDVVATHRLRRDDGDAADDPYRLYEVAGVPHADGAFYRHIPSPRDQTRVGTEPFLAAWPFAEVCTPEIPLLDLPAMRHVMNAAFANLDRWVVDGVAPPRAPRVQLLDSATPRARIDADEFGNARGGVRSVYLDVPTATYHASTGGPGLCRNLGRRTPFDWPRLEQLYGSSAAYRARRDTAIDRLLADRWITAADARWLRDDPVLPALPR